MARGRDARRAGGAQPGRAFARRRPCMDALPLLQSPLRAAATAANRRPQPWPPSALPLHAEESRSVRSPAGDDGPSARSVVAGANRLFALSGTEVRTFDGDGQTLGRCAGFAPPPRRSGGRPSARPDAEETLRAAGLPDDDGTPEAEEALEDEGLGPKRRTRPQPDGGILPHALAASESVRLRLDRHVVRSLSRQRERMPPCRPRRPRSAARRRRRWRRGRGDGQSSLQARRRTRSTMTTTADDARRDLHRLGGVDRAAAGAGARRRRRGNRRGRRRRPGDRRRRGRRRANPRPTDRRGGGLRRRGDRARRRRRLPLDARHTSPSDLQPTAGPGDRLRSHGEAAWIATGLGVWTSPEGANWTERSETLGRRVAAAATLGGRIWLAIDSGLVAFDPTRRGARLSALARQTSSRPTAAGWACADRDAPPRAPHPPLARGDRSLRPRAHARSSQLAGDDAADVSARPRRRAARRSDGRGGRERAPRPSARARAGRPRDRRRHRRRRARRWRARGRLDSVRQEREALR